MLQFLDHGKYEEKKKSQKSCCITKKQHLAQRCLNRPIKPGCFEPLTRVPGWQMVSPHVPQRVQLLGGSSLEHPLLGHTSLLFLPSGLHLILGRGAELQLLPTSTPFLCSARGVSTEQTQVSAFPSSEPLKLHALLRKTATTLQSAISAHHNLSRLQKKCSKLQRFMSLKNS